MKTVYGNSKNPQNINIDKNALIAEILYIIFVHHKGLGTKYSGGTLKRDLKLCSRLIDILYRDAVTDEDMKNIAMGIAVSGKYTGENKKFHLGKLTVTRLYSKEPADKMKKLIEKILRTMTKLFKRQKVSEGLFALHNLPRAYMSNRVSYLLNENLAVSVSDALSYSAFWETKFWGKQ